MINKLYKFTQYFTILIISLFLVACGSSSSSSNDNELNSRTLSASDVSTNVGKTVQISITLSEGSGAITYESKNTDIATVSASGEVTGVSEGNTVIIVNVAETSQHIAVETSLTVSVMKLSRTLSASDISMNVDETTQTSYILSEGTGTITYESADTDIATVSESGTVTGVSEGNTVIIVNVAETAQHIAVETSLTVSVMKLSRTLSAFDISMNVGETTQTSYILSEGTGTITYESADTDIATVSESGTVTGVSAGDTIITVSVAETSQHIAVNTTLKATITVKQYPYFLFASQYYVFSQETEGAWLSSNEGGYVYSGSEGGAAYQWSLTQDGQPYMQQRQALGYQYGMPANATNADSFYITVKAPNRGKINVTNSDKLIIQIGNGIGPDVLSHNVVTLILNGGTQAEDFSWSNSCSYDLQLDKDIQGDESYGIRTHYLDLADFTCSSGNLNGVKGQLSEVVAEIIGGKDSTASETAASPVLLQIGHIAFSGDSTDVASSNKLFASQYEPTGNQGDPWNRSKEGGDIYAFNSSDFVWQWGTDETAMNMRMAYGQQFGHAATVDGSSFFGYGINAPDNGSLDISQSSTMIIQVGNGLGNDVNSHDTVVIELNGSKNEDNSWAYSCNFDLTLDESARPGTDGSSNPWGLRTYEIVLTDFTCDSDTLNGMKNELEQVALKIVGGKDPTASSATDVPTLLMVGFISFK